MVSLTPMGPTGYIDSSFGEPIGGAVMRSDFAVIAGNPGEGQLTLGVVDPATGRLIASSTYTVPDITGNVDMFYMDQETAGFVAMPDAVLHSPTQFACGTIRSDGVVRLEIIDFPHGAAAHVYDSSGLGFYDMITKQWSGKYWTEYSRPGPFIGWGLVINFLDFTLTSYPLTQYMGAGEDLGDIYYGTCNLPDGRYIAARNNWQLRHKPDDSDQGSEFFIVDQDGFEFYRTPNYGATNYNDDLTIRQVDQSGIIGVIWSHITGEFDPIPLNPITLLLIDTRTERFEVIASYTFGEAYPFGPGETFEQRMLVLNNEDDINTLGMGFRAIANQLSPFGGVDDPHFDYAAVQVPSSAGFGIGTLDRAKASGEFFLDGGGQLAINDTMVLYYARDEQADDIVYYRLFNASIATRGPRLSQRTDGLGAAAAPKRLAQGSATQNPSGSPKRLGGANTY